MFLYIYIYNYSFIRKHVYISILQRLYHHFCIHTYTWSVIHISSSSFKSHIYIYIYIHTYVSCTSYTPYISHISFISSITYISSISLSLYGSSTAGTFKLWSLSNFSTEYLSSERHDDSVPKMKSAKAPPARTWDAGLPMWAATWWCLLVYSLVI